MIQDTAPLQENSVDALLELLKFADRSYTEDMLQSPPQSIRAVIPSASSQKSVRRGSPGQTSQKVKRCKLSANWFIDVAAVENDEEGDEDEEEDGAEELIHCPQPVGPSGKQSYQQTIDAIIERLNHKIPEEAAFKSPKISQLPGGVTLPPQKSIFIVDFFSGTVYKMFIDSFSYIMVLHSQCQNIRLPVHDVARISGDDVVMVSSPTVCRGFQSH